MGKLSLRMKRYTWQRNGNPKPKATEPMAESIPRPELEKLLSAIEGRMDDRFARMEKDTDRRASEFRAETDRRAAEFQRELELRDAALKRELDQRRETFLTEQALREKALDDRYAGFLATQAERDKRLDESVTAIRGDIARLGSLKLNIWGAMLTAVGIGVAIAALSLSFYQTGKTDKTAQPPSIETPAPATKQ
jgi:hypothetical protein